jgi:diguanylate cyclase (GGDEF)-like protein
VPQVSFRLRLILFFVLIVVLPIAALAVLVTQIAEDSESGKIDAQLSAGLRTATTVYEGAEAESQRTVDELARDLAADPDAVAALRSGDTDALRSVADGLIGGNVVAVSLTDSQGNTVSAGAGRSVAGAAVDLTAAGQAVGAVTASSVSSSDLLTRISDATGEDAALVGAGGVVEGEADIEASALPESGDPATVEAAEGELRVAATEPLGSEQVRIALFAPAGGEGFLSSQPKVAIALIAFILVALIAVGFVLRALQGQIREMLGAARRIGGGDFSGEVPVSGKDEMAGLATEFNRMSDRLADQMDQLRRQRVEIEKSVRRVGEAFASGLDRQALLEILVETAVGTCEADYGLVALRGHAGAEAEAGTGTDAVQEAALGAEQRSLREAGPVEVEEDGAYAFASSLGRIGQTATPVGAMTIARGGQPFNSTEREVFLYLVGQAAASVENVALHEIVSEQAVTDDLTGLANKRAFSELMDKEAARAQRFGHDVSLLICDIDDFKRVNDTYGHPQGDAVLRAVGRILAEESRGIDFPARYGGEEFVVALPETSSEGAMEVAERIRERVAAQQIPLLEGDGRIRVTTSIGLATLPGAAATAEELIAKADAALYEAKRAGKNRVVVAELTAPPAPKYGRRATDRPAQVPATPRRK